LKLVLGGMTEPVIALALEDLSSEEAHTLIHSLASSRNVQIHAAVAIALRSLAKQKQMATRMLACNMMDSLNLLLQSEFHDSKWHTTGALIRLCALEGISWYWVRT
jgi:hypothetical protein